MKSRTLFFILQIYYSSINNYFSNKIYYFSCVLVNISVTVKVEKQVFSLERHAIIILFLFLYFIFVFNFKPVNHSHFA